MRRALALAVAMLVMSPGTAGAAPWRAADTVRDALFDAQTELILGSRAAADVARARDAYRGDLRSGIRAADRDADAEQARLEAYAFFEFGPERRLKAFDPGLALDVEGAMWFGAGEQPGLAKLIADRAPRRSCARRAAGSTPCSPTPPQRSATARAAEPSSPTPRSSSSARASRRY